MLGNKALSKTEHTVTLPMFLFALSFLICLVLAKLNVEETPADALFIGDMVSEQTITTKNFPIEPVEALAREMATILQPGIRKPIEVRVVFRNEATPLVSISKTTSRCNIVLNSNPKGWANWKYFFNETDKSEWMNLAELSIAHEIGHCTDFESSLAAGTDMKKKSVLSGEVFADVYATLYAQELMGSRAKVSLRVLAQVREDLAWLQPDHATGRYLRNLHSKIMTVVSEHDVTPAELARLSHELTRH
jgi:hypothetical protein